MLSFKNISFTVIMEKFFGVVNVGAVYHQEMIND